MLLAASQLFAYGKFTFIQRGGKLHVKQCAMEQSFIEISADMNRLACAGFLCGLCEVFLREGDAQTELFRLLLVAMSHLAHNGADIRGITVFVLIKLLAQMGFAPMMDTCVRCGASVAQPERFDAQLGGVLCNRCGATYGTMAVTKRGCQTIRFALELPVERMHVLKMDDAARGEVWRIMRPFCLARMEYSPKSLDFLESVVQMGADG